VQTSSPSELTVFLEKEMVEEEQKNQASSVF
jgi:hypothetical protein